MNHKFLKLIFPIIILFFAFCSSCDASKIRQAATAGQFYPSGSKELAQMVDGFLKNVPTQNIPGRTVAMLSPHAGYIYSGQTAAFSYKILNKRNVKNLILIGNSHHFQLKKGAVYASGAFQTPLGDVPVNSELAQSILSRTNLLEENNSPHGPEHSLEVQLPFLQRALDTFRIVPILLGNFSLEQCRQAGEAVAGAITDLGLSANTIIIASSDMSHYPSMANANMADNSALESLKKFNPAELKKTIDGFMASNIPNLSCVFCGEESLYTTMYAARSLGASSVKVLKYTNSGEISGDKSRVVGYGSAVFFSPGSNLNPKNSPAPRDNSESEDKKMNEFSVSEKNQKELLSVARNSITHFLETGKIMKLGMPDAELAVPSAVFVTLTKKKNLRGCIGSVVPQLPLQDTVNQMAVAAAFEDSRFPQVTKNELKDIKIEISVLSPMKLAKNADEIQQGIHGVFLRKGRCSGLFLPQVWEHFDTKEGFLNELCQQKAGLAPEAWKDPETDLYIFTVFSFEED